MSYQVIYLTKVQYDLQDAYNYYENQRAGLGEEFLEQVEVIIEYIRNYPLHFQVVLGDTRKSNLTRFPYAIFYYVDNNFIKIAAIIHLQTDPQKWSLYE